MRRTSSYTRVSLLSACAIAIAAVFVGDARVERVSQDERFAEGKPARALASSPPSALRVEKAGLSITFELRPRDGRPLVSGADADAVFTFEDAATGAPVTNLRPFAWMSRQSGAAAGGDAACKEKIGRWLGGALAAQADVDMNAYLMWSIEEEGTISIINPRLAFQRTKLQRLVELSGRPGEAALGPGQRVVYVTIPEANEVAVIDTERTIVRARVPVGERPSRLAVSPDGKSLWVANDGDETVSVLDMHRDAVIGTLGVGRGSHAVAFTHGGKRAFIASRESSSVVVVDTASLSIVAKMDVGAGATDIAASDAARALLVARGASGEVVIVDAERASVASRLSLEPGLGPLRFAPDGRFAFVLGRSAGVVDVVDTSIARVVHRLTGFASPDAIAFTEAYAYVRHGGEGKVSLIELGALSKSEALPVVDIPVGRGALARQGASFHPALIAPLPEGGGAVIAHPSDKSFYMYTEGMMAPAGTISTRGQTPRALLFVDRSLREVSPGVFSARVHLERGGPYDVALLVEEPRFHVCLEQVVPTSPEEALPPSERIALEPLFDPSAYLAAMMPKALRFRVHDRGSSDPVRPEEIDAIVVREPTGFRSRPSAKDVGDGVFEVSFSPPRPGRYRFLVGVPSRGAKVGSLQGFSLGVKQEGEKR